MPKFIKESWIFQCFLWHFVLSGLWLGVNTDMLFSSDLIQNLFTIFADPYLDRGGIEYFSRFLSSETLVQNGNQTHIFTPR